MFVRRFDDPLAFREAATPFLVRDEARHNLMLGICSTLIQRPSLYELFDLWLVVDRDEVASAALRTPPFNLVLAQPSADEGLETLIDRLLEEEQELPGVVAAIPELETFVAMWTSARDLDATRVIRHGIYEVRRVSSLPPAPGRSRPAAAADRELVLGWASDFADEVLPEGDPGPRGIEARLEATESSGVWLWEDAGVPVSMSGYGGETPSGIRIGPVYTPPELRGRGYATTLVAEQSRWLLGTGRRFCFLYTDLDNPASNALYRRIGYRMVAEAGEVRFDPKDVA
jgi:predicted GNAT family acetyltransferase